ncbi:MAG: 3-hydroxyacyl-ACP dehydratase FabZ [Candidatus Omnitrophota bacterium]|nr:3-hydroxyacyl-ACP dehydratase FabZ [Candidatus Omnitrophota bacterium]
MDGMLNIEEIKSLIPQRYPFLMLDRVVEIKAGQYIKAYKNVSINEACFNGHFPGNPVFPGAFIAEAMAQAACILLKKSVKDLDAKLFYITNAKLRFLKVVSPGDQLRLTVKSIKMVRTGGIFNTEATVDNNMIARGEMAFACK